MKYIMIQIKQYLLLCAVLVFLPCAVLAQGTWAFVEGGWDSDIPYSVQQTSDGGYIVAGGTYSQGAGDCDLWIMKLDSTGAVTWQKTMGGPYYDLAYSAQQTSDGGYIVAGGTFSYGAGNSDYWVIKLNSSGSVVWQKTFGGSGYDFAHFAGELTGGGYYVGGRTWSFGSGDGDFWLLKLDSTGTIWWQRAYGGTAQDTGYSVKLTSDGGYLIGGGTWSFGAGNGDFWLMKLDSAGNIAWQKSYGGSGFDYIYSVDETSGGYVAAGWTNSFGAGNTDVWIINVDGTGNLLWQKTYGGTAFDYAHSIVRTSDGGYVVAGRTESFGAGNGDFWLLKLDASGNVTWQKTYGGSSADSAIAIKQTSDGGYIAVGRTSSYGMGINDFLVIKLDTNGSLDAACTFFTNTSVTPSNSSIAGVDSSAALTTSTAVIGNPAVTSVDSSAMHLLICPPSPVLYSNRLLIDDSASSSPNGIIEPDESIAMKGKLQNSGTNPAASVTAILSTSDPVTITNANATYPDLPAGSNGDCITCYGMVAPASNRTAVHWDFVVTELPTCTGCSPVAYNFRYHVGNSFSDVPLTHLFYKYIETVLHATVTSGCTATTYCPASLVPRQQMAKFICRSIEISEPGSCPTTACTNIFGDVPASNIFCPDIEALYRTGVVSGCQSSPLLYCPGTNTQRQIMAKFVCLAMNTANSGSCQFSTCTGIFDDVPASNLFCGYIEGLYNAGVINGCTATSYCPTNTVSRDQMAKFLVNAFGFQL